MGLTIDQLVATLAANQAVRPNVLVNGRTQVATRIQIIEQLDRPVEVRSGTVVFLTQLASRQAVDYHLDVTIRRLSDAAAVVIMSDCERPSPTGLNLAHKLGISIIRFEAPVDLGKIVTRTVSLLNGDTAVTIDLVGQMLADVESSVARSAKPADIVEDLGADRLGIQVGQKDERLMGVPAMVTEPAGLWLQRESTTPLEDLVAELISWRIAASVTRETIEHDRAAELSILSSGAILDQLLNVVDEDERQRLVRRARTVGLPIDGWHEALRLEFSNLLTLCDDDPIATYGQNQELSQLAMQTACRQGGRWSMTIRPSGAVLVRTRSRPRSASEARTLLSQAGAILTQLRERVPNLNIYCGIGSSHEGVAGMSATDAEANTAIQSARLRGAVNVPTVFDAPGIQRLLVEWFASRTVRESVDDLLAPLSEIQSRSKQRDYLNTLRVYLDCHRSVSRAAEILFVHRNTVLYRVNKIVELLGVDLDDPHQMLALHLACHAEMAVHPSFNG